MSESRTRMMVILALGITAVVVWWPQSSDCACLKISFLDIGQGDAIYIETPDNYDVLIDGGPGNSVLRALGTEMDFFDKTLDLVIATHPDLDHIGGLVDVLERFRVKHVLVTTNRNDTPAATAFLSAISEENAQQIQVEAGQLLRLGDSVYLEVLSPTGDETNWETNNASIVARLVYGDTAVMLTGDASLKIENYLAERYGSQLQSDVLKLGHHGSKTSTSDSWLTTVDPQHVVVSAGLDNRYGHPHQEVMARVFARAIKTSHTGIDGTVTFYSDGQTVWQK